MNGKCHKKKQHPATAKNGKAIDALWEGTYLKVLVLFVVVLLSSLPSMPPTHQTPLAPA
jgi:hypothetical protein